MIPRSANLASVKEQAAPILAQGLRGTRSEPEKIAYSIKEAAKACGLSRAFIYAEWQAGRGPRKFKVGKRTLIMADALWAWLHSFEIVE